jgi:hypothetical protein
MQRPANKLLVEDARSYFNLGRLHLWAANSNLTGLSKLICKTNPNFTERASIDTISKHCCCLEGLKLCSLLCWRPYTGIASLAMVPCGS